MAVEKRVEGMRLKIGRSRGACSVVQRWFAPNGCNCFCSEDVPGDRLRHRRVRHCGCIEKHPLSLNIAISLSFVPTGLEVSRTLTSLEARHWCGDLNAPCEQIWEIGEGEEEEADERGDDKDECFSAVEWSMHCDKGFTSSCKMKLRP